MKFKSLKVVMLVCLTALALIATGCAPTMQMAKPEQLTAPLPIQDNSGKYLSPYTSDDVLAEWVDTAVKAKAASGIGAVAGAKLGEEALKKVPFVGGFLGQKVGSAIGKKIVIESAGGWDAIKESSDLSFNNLDDMAVYLYVKHSQSEHYQDALDAAFGIYPEFKQQYSAALWKATRTVQ